MGKRRARARNQTCKRPTLAQKNMEPKPEVEDLFKEKNVRLDEVPTKTDAADADDADDDDDDDATEPWQTTVNDLVHVTNELTHAYIAEREVKDVTIKTLTQKLEEERKKNAELENINKQLREENCRETCSVC